VIQTEHIYPTLGTYVSDLHAPVINGRPRERVVRCRDCDNLNIVGKCPCGFFALENLDGFCAWGEAE